MFRFRPGGKALFIQAGGKFSYLINHKVNYTDPSNDITRTSTVNHLRQWDAGAISGLSVWLGSHVTVDLRYYHRLAPMIKKHWVLDHTLEPVFRSAHSYCPVFTGGNKIDYIKKLENGGFALLEQCAIGRRPKPAKSGTLPVEFLYALTVGGIATFPAGLSFYPLHLRQVLRAPPNQRETSPETQIWRESYTFFT